MDGRRQRRRFGEGKQKLGRPRKTERLVCDRLGVIVSRAEQSNHHAAATSAAQVDAELPLLLVA
jgi:hypothetical protein